MKKYKLCKKCGEEKFDFFCDSCGEHLVLGIPFEVNCGYDGEFDGELYHFCSKNCLINFFSKDIYRDIDLIYG